MLGYLRDLLESDEMKFCISNYGKGFVKTATEKRIEAFSDDALIKEIEMIKSKTSTLSKRERDLVLYFAQKRLKTI